MAQQSFLSKLAGIKKNEDDELTVSLLGSREPWSSTTDDETAGWGDPNYDGQLAVDVYQTKNEIVIKSAVAGVNPEDLDISINSDMVTIRGVRHKEESVGDEDYFYQECYFGAFSRSIILPREIDAGKAIAEFKKGILTIRLPKAEQTKKITIQVRADE